MNLEHDRCSELLGPLLRGELSEREARSVEDHIAGCEECRAEKRGLQALLGAPEVMKVSAEELSDIERARLHKAVRAALPGSRTIVSEPPKPWTARIAPYLGAAAAVILVAFGVTQFDLGGSDDEGTADGGAALRESDEEAFNDQGGAEAGAGGDSADVAEDAPDPGPSFESNAGVIQRNELRRFGSKEEPFVTFSQTFAVEDAETLRTKFLSDLDGAAQRTLSNTSEESLSDEDTITECGEQVLEAQDNPTLPAYAGYGQLEKKDVLMMGFVYSAEDSGPLDKFMLWIWPRGDCSVPDEYQFGTIKP